MQIQFLITRLLPLALWSGAVAATTVWVVGSAGSVSAKQMFVTTDLVKTGRQLDLVIAGDGYFVVQDVLVPGGFLFTRYGRFAQNEQGQLVVQVGDYARTVEPLITIPPDATDIYVGRDGQVSYVQPGEATPAIAGTIALARFDHPELLQPYEDQLLFLPVDGATPRISTPGHPGLGSLRQHKLEASVLKQAVSLESPAANYGPE